MVVDFAAADGGVVGDGEGEAVYAVEGVWIDDSGGAVGVGGEVRESQRGGGDDVDARGGGCVAVGGDDFGDMVGFVF